MSTPTDRPESPVDEPIAIDPERVAAPRRRALQLAGGLGATVAIVVVIALIANSGSGSGSAHSTPTRAAGDDAGLILAVQSGDGTATTPSSTTPSTTSTTTAANAAAPAAPAAMPSRIAAVTNGNLVVLDAADGHVVLTVATGLAPPTGEFQFALSPSADGATIYYSRFQNVVCGQRGVVITSEIDRVPVAGGPSERVVGEANNPKASPDGRSLAYTTPWCTNPHVLVVRDLASGTERPAPAVGEMRIPRAWAADSRSLIASTGVAPTIGPSLQLPGSAVVDVSGTQLAVGAPACCFMVGTRVVGQVSNKPAAGSKLFAAEVAALPNVQPGTAGGSGAPQAPWTALASLGSADPVVDIDTAGRNVLQLRETAPAPAANGVGAPAAPRALSRASLGQPSNAPAQSVELAKNIDAAAWIPSAMIASTPAPTTVPVPASAPCPTPAAPATPSTSSPTTTAGSGGAGSGPAAPSPLTTSSTAGPTTATGGTGGAPPQSSTAAPAGAPTWTAPTASTASTTSTSATSSLCPRLVLLDPSDGHVVRVILSNLDVAGPHSISVSSDGQTAYVARRTESQCPSSQVPSAEILEVSLRGTGEPRVIARSGQSPYVSPDGKHLAYLVSECAGSGSAPKRALAVRDLTTDVVRTRDNVEPLAWSSDSSTIVARSYTTQGIELIDATSPTLVGKPLPLVGIDPIGYAGDQLVGERHTNGDEIVNIDTATGKASKARATVPTGSTVAGINDDGDLLLFTAETATSSGTRPSAPNTWTLSRFHAGRVNQLGTGVAAAAWVPARKAVESTTSTSEQAPTPQGGSRLSTVEQSPSVSG